MPVNLIELWPNGMQTGLHIPKCLICRETYVLLLYLKHRLGSQGNSLAHETCACKFKRMILTLIIPPAAAYSIHPSLQASVSPSIYPSEDEFVSAMCLPQYLSDPHHIYASYLVTPKSVACLFICKIPKFRFLAFLFLTCNCDFVLFWHGMRGNQYDSMLLIIMGQWSIFWECKHSSCSGFYWFIFFI